MSSYHREQRRVVCAANRYHKHIILGIRHWDTAMRTQFGVMEDHGMFDDEITPGQWEQGFVDQFGKFMTREEAWIVAEAAGQIIHRCGGDGEKLFSENLY